ncbi:hypothetical protein N7535_005087 [Penicillium sp. DV-2018c]|nr:hypothetical protein N7461_008666 [Penicillium sp. DV-2018c]KAJ5571427.1 hypothetical protein N7535_005087 [Penicillium sp. DV-2018c]
MSAKSASLDCLPVEILEPIFRLLDPIGLISISQTNSYFRRVVQPKREHFVEWLLALECTARYEHLWACTVCLKLLPSLAFLLPGWNRFEYGKPSPGSLAAEPYKYTSWEPPGDARRRECAKEPRKDWNESQILHRYFISRNIGSHINPYRFRERLATYQRCGMIAFQGIDPESDEYTPITLEEELDTLDYERRLVERDYRGYKRHLRECMECKRLSRQ